MWYCSWKRRNWKGPNQVCKEGGDHSHVFGGKKLLHGQGWLHRQVVVIKLTSPVCTIFPDIFSGRAHLDVVKSLSSKAA